MTDIQTRTAPVPFSGFYNSCHEYALQQALESLAQDENGTPQDEECARLDRNMQWPAAFLTYAQLYCSRLADETGAQWEFAALVSPRFYNYSTDEIDVTLSLSELQRVRDTVPDAALQDMATERLTARSGFIPSYPSGVREWGELSEWDSSLLGLLIECYCDAMGQDAESRDLYLVDDCNGDVTACIEAGLPDDREVYA